MNVQDSVSSLETLRSIIDGGAESDDDSIVDVDVRVAYAKFGLLDTLIKRISEAEYLPLPSSASQGIFNSLSMVSQDVNINVFDACRDIIGTDSDMRVHFRSSGAVSLCCQFINSCFKANTEGSFDGTCLTNLALLGSCILLLGVAVKDDSASKVCFKDTDTVNQVKKLVFNRNKTVSKSSDSDSETRLKEALTILSGSLLVLQECSKEVHSGHQISAMVTKDKKFLHEIGPLLHELSNAFSIHVANRYLILESITTCASIVKEIAFMKDGTKCISECSGTIVCALGSALHCLSSSQPLYSSSNSMLTLLEALLGCSQSDLLRPFFAVECPPCENSECPPCENRVTVVRLLTQLVKTTKSASCRTTSLGVLVNACLDSDGSNTVRECALANGALDAAFSCVSAGLSLADEQRCALGIVGSEGDVIAGIDGFSLSRSMGLIARLSTLSAAQSILEDPEKYRQICQVLRRNISVFPSYENKYEEQKWVIEERTNAVRVLSGIVKLSSECYTIALQENLIPSLCLIFPAPREELGQITPSSVTQIPHNIASALVLGNAARCLMHFADHTECAASIFDIHSSLHPIERFICAMASCSDLRVRKNIAILIAKGCRLCGVREKVDYFRGMQIIRELQASF